MPRLPDCPVGVEEHGSVVRHFASTSTSLHTLYLDTGYWGDLSLDGKRHFCSSRPSSTACRQDHIDTLLHSSGEQDWTPYLTKILPIN